jgi:alpha-beta hydrolase superfamily lysophospholipase
VEPLAFYGLEDLAPGYSHRFITFPWSGSAPGTRAGQTGRLSVHAFRHRESPAASVSGRRDGAPPCRGTVLLLHGYLDHALVNGKTIRLLVESGYDVLAPDFPGHGLSDGEESAIDDFGTYAEAVRSVLADAGSGAPAMPADAATPAVPATAPAPGSLFVVGHSAGAAAVLAYCNRYGCPFKSVVFIAPLVRTVGWRVIKIFLPILRLFSRRIIRRPGACSSDRDFAAFHRADPRMAQTASLEWSRAMLDWEARLDEYTRFPDSAVVIQGTKDSVVSWRHNLRFLGRKISNLSITLVPGGMHCLLNEREELRVHVEKLILDALDLSPVSGYEVP